MQPETGRRMICGRHRGVWTAQPECRLPVLAAEHDPACDEHRAYHRSADAHTLYHQRGLVLSHLVDWCDEALRLAGT